MGRNLLRAVIVMLAVLVIFGFEASQNPAEAARTKLLFPYVTNISGWDTGIAITYVTLNLPMTGPTPTGKCTVYYQGTLWGGGYPPSPQTIDPIHMGETITFTLSQGGVPGSPPGNSTEGFQGYMLVDCNFTKARGLAFISDYAGNAASTYLAEVVK